MALDVELQVVCGETGLPAAKLFERWANAAWQQGEASAGVVIRIVGEAESQELNAEFRRKDMPTNVLSFPYERLPGMPFHHAGDLVICAPVVQREAAEQHKGPEAHWAHMVVHGMLHLQGYDHADDAEAERMEARETAILAGLGYPAPYATDET
jgi:probable rRNA maturation factor